MRTKWIWLGAVALATMTTACSGGTKSPSAASSTTATTSATAATSTLPPDTTAAPTTVTTTATGSTVAGSTGCHSGQLTVAVTNSQGAAGTIYSHLTFTNKSAIACTMTGYPGVSFVDGAGHQVGAPLNKLPGYGGTVSLAAKGGIAASLFLYHDAYVGTSPLCLTPVPTAGLRVYPPNETASLFASDPTTACANTAATGVGEVSAITTPSKLPG